VDVTLTRDLNGKITRWAIDDSAVASDHSLITFTLKDSFTLIPQMAKVRFNDRKIDVYRLRNAVEKSLIRQPRDGTLDGDARAITNAINEACRRILPRSRKKRPSKPPWWNTEITQSRQTVTRLKRLMLRTGNRADRETYKVARNIHVSNIRKAKKDIWMSFVQDSRTTKTPWGKLTRWLINGSKDCAIPSVLQRPDGAFTDNLKQTVELLLQELIPHSTDDPSPELIPVTSNQPPTLRTNTDELKAVVWRQKNKAPGGDGITAKIVRSVWPIIKDELLRLVNHCLRLHIFPDCWKSAILLKGKGKDPLKLKSYRPVSLLPVLGKIFEEVICNLLEANIGSRLSPNQHGFRPLKSTTTALNEVRDWLENCERYALCSFLDINGAFDNVIWPKLAYDMVSLDCDPSLVKIAMDYLANRTATYNIGSECRTIRLTRGCPQGSKFGPRLWNITMDPLLKKMTLSGTHIVAYADDIALLVTCSTRNDIIGKTEKALEIVTAWADERGLNFSREKSVMVPLKGGLVPGFTAKMGTYRIKSVSSTKYLGLLLGKDFTFDDHATNLLTSSSDMFSRLKGIRKSKWGTSSELAMMLYKSVYLPRILYGASTWYPRIRDKRKIVQKLISAQRKALLAVSGAYNTVSTMALQVITGSPPLDLQIEMRIDIERGTPIEEARSTCLGSWQERWDASTKGRWTYSFLPDINQRMSTLISFGHYLCQMITGHGDMNKKLHSFKLTEDPTCRCGHHEETAEHILADCPLAAVQRHKLQDTMHGIGLLTVHKCLLLKGRTSLERFNQIFNRLLIQQGGPKSRRIGTTTTTIGPSSAQGSTQVGMGLTTPRRLS